MKSVIAKNIAKGGEYAENTRMDSLKNRHKSLSRYIPEVGLEGMMHVIGGFYCPVSVLYGNPYVHTSNGGYAAKTLDGKTVYVSCPYCVFEKTMVDSQETLMDMVVPGTEDSRYPWVMYTEENYQKIMKADKTSGVITGATHTHPANNSKKKNQKK